MNDNLSMTLPPPARVPVPSAFAGAERAPERQPVRIDIVGLSFYYGGKRALENISLQVRTNLVTAFIGPSGCGKSTLLRTLNRMNDIIPDTRVSGHVIVAGRDIY